jgi:hypothetical protein
MITVQRSRITAFNPTQLFFWETWNLTKTDYCTYGDRNIPSHLAVPLGDVEPYKR